MNSIMDSEPDVCVACLACNTTLWPLGEYEHLYKMLLGKDNLDNSDLKQRSCADCRDMLEKIMIFQQKIRSSQDVLLMKVTEISRQTSNKQDLKVEFDKNQNGHSIDIEVASDYFKRNDDCKDEPFDDIGSHYDIDDGVVETIKEEPLEDAPYCPITELCSKIEGVKKENIKEKVKNKNKKYYPRYKNVAFNILSGQELLKRNYRYYSKKSCDTDVRALDDEARLSWSYRNSKFKCRSCVKGFKENEDLQKHNQNKHAESIGPYVCDICEIRTATKKSLEMHVRQHYNKYECKLCDKVMYKKWQLRMHFIIRHKKLYECPHCGIIITHSREYFRHYKMMHQRFICDYCNKVYKDRHWFENHILKFHTKFECKPCNKTFAYFRNYDAHNKLLHTAAASESTYCVECDIQFENRARYSRHINTSTRHLGRNRKKSANCPECGKLYACRNNMMNHYKLEHLKVTNYQCTDCNRFFLNSFRLKEHRLVNHEKKGRAKNKFCSYCGRGFSNNRILLYHVRTHTGERPHACEHCSATFAQPFALATHVKARHKDIMK